MKKVLFILKKRGTNYQSEVVSMKPSMSSGLFNSVQFVSKMLNDNGYESSFVEVNDNNDIDRVVTEYRPDIVIIEAVWVVPDKFKILHKLHPHIHWIVRIHSEMPFIANEGIALDWLFGYVKQHRVSIATNTRRMEEDLKELLMAKFPPHLIEEKVLYLPNYYVIPKKYRKEIKDFPIKDEINIGCFGAIRPLKNQLIQALAAIEFARKHGKRLKFHINGSRVEQGNNVLKNIKNVFSHLNPEEFKLVEHPWLNHDDFLKLVAQMDIGLQVSFSETFNIVTADFVSQDIPIVVSDEISWLEDWSYASTTDSHQIAHMIHEILEDKEYIVECNRFSLEQFNYNSEVAWIEYLG